MKKNIIWLEDILVKQQVYVVNILLILVLIKILKLYVVKQMPKILTVEYTKKKMPLIMSVKNVNMVI